MYPIKFLFNNVVRRTQISKDEMSATKMFDTATKMFFSHGENKIHADFHIAYKDDEDDIVMVSTDEEFQEAIRLMQGEEAKAFRFIIIPKSGSKVESSGSASLASSLNSASAVEANAITDDNAVPVVSIPVDASNAEEKAKLVHFGVSCDGCGMEPIVGDRFKCTHRNDYDLCEACVTIDTSEFPMVKITDHLPGGSSVDTSQNSQVHHGVKCDDCGVTPIIGGRNKCTIRDDYDLCDNCVDRDTTGFPMSKIVVPIPVQFHWRKRFRPRCGPFGGSRGRGGGPAFFGGRGGNGRGGIGRPHNYHPHRHPHHPSPRGDRHLSQEFGSTHPPTPLPAPIFRPVFGGKVRGCDPGRKEEMMKKWSEKIEKLQGRIKSMSEQEEALVQEAIYESLSDGEENAVSKAVEESIKSNNKTVCHVPTAPPAVPALPKPALRFVRDITYPDGIIIAPGTEFNKVWRIRNDGSVDWPCGVVLCNAGGDILSDPEACVELPVLKAGKEVNIHVQLRAPECSGRFVSYFSAKTAEGQGFGQRLWASVVVSEDAIQYSILEHEDSLNDTETPIATTDEKSVKDSVHHEATHVVVGDAKILDIVEEDALNTPLTQSTTTQNTADPTKAEESAPIHATTTAPAPNVVHDSSYSWCSSSQDGSSTMEVTIDAALDVNGDVSSTGGNVEAEQWAKELTLLQEMGFVGSHDIIPLLVEHCKTPASHQGGVPNQNGLMQVVGTLLQS